MQNVGLNIILTDFLSLVNFVLAVLDKAMTFGHHSCTELLSIWESGTLFSGIGGSFLGWVKEHIFPLSLWKMYWCLTLKKGEDFSQCLGHDKLWACVTSPNYMNYRSTPFHKNVSWGQLATCDPTLISSGFLSSMPQSHNAGKLITITTHRRLSSVLASLHATHWYFTCFMPFTSIFQNDGFICYAGILCREMSFGMPATDRRDTVLLRILMAAYFENACYKPIQKRKVL